MHNKWYIYVPLRHAKIFIKKKNVKMLNYILLISNLFTNNIYIPYENHTNKKYKTINSN